MAQVELYSRQWCPYCAKAKALLRAKGLEFDEIDVTHDRPAEKAMFERSQRLSVPQIFVLGELVGGYDDLAMLNATGELDRRLKIRTPPLDLTQVYDVAVIGAGPAGLTAAMYAVRKNLSTILVSGDLGGQVGVTREIANYPGFDGVTGPDLMQHMYEQAESYGIDRLLGERVTSVTVDGRVKVLQLASERAVRARTVIVATGARKRKLGIPGEKELSGRGVVYCSTCDGPLFRGKAVAIVGGGNSALEAALELHGVASSVTVVTREGWTGDKILRDKVAAARDIVQRVSHEPIEIHGDDKVVGLTIKDVETGETERLDVDGVFVEVGWFPNTDFVLDLVETNRRGEIVVDAHGSTGVRGVFAAGDATDSRDKQIVISAGEGARAALAAFEYLVTQK
jgi:NADH-dependent peroxiredoxin subunit F